MKHFSAFLFLLVIAGGQVSMAAAAPAALTPADQAAANALAAQIEADVCQAGSIAATHCSPVACTAANANLQQEIQQLIIAAGLQPNVVLVALRQARGLLPAPENPSTGPSCEVSAIDGLERTVLAQIGANKPAGAGGGGGSQNGSPAFANSDGSAND
jgi:hypothetical protein